jgi:single-stranded-DNA-specific exonuclease
MDPFLLEDMEKASTRILQAIRTGERICIFGDYDVDGLTATAVLLLTVRSLGADAAYYIPHRLREGYGLQREAIDQIAAAGAQLIVTVDNGISAVEEIAHARRLGLDVVVTDHHQPGPELPEAVAVVNPNRTDAYYPHARLSGVGVAFKVAHAVLKRAGVPRETGQAVLGDLLELVALGTLADIVPLEGENRILARWGLERLAQSRRAGLQALLELTGRIGKPATAHTVNFVLAPRLNAAGRTGEALLGLQLLLTDDRHEAAELARELNRLNDERRDLEKGILTDSLEVLGQRGHLEQDTVLVAAGEGWHLGVLGIVAARIMEQYNRPVIVLAVEREIARGSARSVEGYNIHRGLDSCKDLLLSYGGHAAAAGLRLRQKMLEEFRLAINEHAREVLGEERKEPPLTIDTQVDPEELDLGLIEALHALEPFGQENPEPVLALCGARLAGSPRIVGTGHLRLDLRAGDRMFRAIGFNLASLAPTCEAANENLDVAFVPRLNEWRGERSVELQMRDLRPGARAGGAC